MLELLDHLGSGGVRKAIDNRGPARRVEHARGPRKCTAAVEGVGGNIVRATHGIRVDVRRVEAESQGRGRRGQSEEDGADRERHASHADADKGWVREAAGADAPHEKDEQC